MILTVFVLCGIASVAFVMCLIMGLSEQNEGTVITWVVGLVVAICGGLLVWVSTSQHYDQWMIDQGIAIRVVDQQTGKVSIQPVKPKEERP